MPRPWFVSLYLPYLVPLHFGSLLCLSFSPYSPFVRMSSFVPFCSFFMYSIAHCLQQTNLTSDSERE